MSNGSSQEKIQQQNQNCAMDDKKKIGTVSPEERDQIKTLFERKNGLSELFKTLSGLSGEELDSNPLYDKVVKDMGEVSRQFQKWWDDMSKKHNWENLPGYKWEIDFESCDIFIRKQ